MFNQYSFKHLLIAPHKHTVKTKRKQAHGKHLIRIALIGRSINRYNVIVFNEYCINKQLTLKRWLSNWQKESPRDDYCDLCISVKSFSIILKAHVRAFKSKSCLSGFCLESPRLLKSRWRQRQDLFTTVRELPEWRGLHSGYIPRIIRIISFIAKFVQLHPLVLGFLEGSLSVIAYFLF